jgi:hypothetical protein
VADDRVQDLCGDDGALGLGVGIGEQPVEGARGEEQRVGLVVGAVDIPVSCSRAPPATTTSASRSRIPWSVTIAGSTPALTSSRSSRRAMLRTICMWTQEWSDIPSRSELTWAMYHQPRT